MTSPSSLYELYTSTLVHPRLQTIPKPVDGEERQPLASIASKALASYSTSSSSPDQPAIIVPGFPPIWSITYKAASGKLPVDTGLQIIDHQAYYFPTCHIEPMLQSTRLCNPDLDFSTFQVVSDRNLFRKMHAWFSGETKTFRVDAEKVGEKTVIFHRRERSILDEEGRFPGFSQEFKKRQLVGGIENSMGYHRISAVTIDGLTILLRYEVDAQPSLKVTSSTSLIGSIETTDLTPLLTSHGLTLPTSTSSSSNNAALTELKQFPDSTLSYQINPSLIISQSALIELKTRSVNSLNVQNILPDAFGQLGYSQTPFLYIASHRAGAFSRDLLVKHELGKGELGGEVEEEGLRVMAKVVRLVKRMREIVLAEGAEEGGLSFVFEGEEMEVWRTGEEDREPLSKELRALF